VLGAPSADTLDVDGNFFDTGGHSMLLATLAERLSARLSRAIPILDLYQYPSVAALARQLDDPTVDSTAEAATDSRPRPGRDNAARLRAVRARNQRTRGSQGAQA
jgi:hypothetical protein